MKTRLLTMLICLGIAIVPSASAEGNPGKLLMPIGGGHTEVYSGFAQTAILRAQNNTVNILVLPIAYASDPFTISETERSESLKLANERRLQIEAACRQVAPPGIVCQTTLVPVLVRPDAENPAMLTYFAPDLTSVFILGGDQTIAMQVIGSTPFEAALGDAYNRGVLIAGSSAGGAIQSSTMLGGYNPGYSEGASLDFGAVDVWIPPERHGLPFGIQNAIIDQHFYQRSRPGRLLNAIALPDVPHVGIGIDAYTGVHAPDGQQLEDVFGGFTVTILDAETYHAADAVQYRGQHNTLSLRNVLVHLLAPGGTGYDLITRQHSLSPLTRRMERKFEALHLPDGAGTLILAGGLSETLPGNPVLNHFTNLAGGRNGNILVIASGYTSDSAAQAASEDYKRALGVPAQTYVLSPDSTQRVEVQPDITGILLVGRDQTKIQPNLLEDVRRAWLSGVPVMADDAAAAIAGQVYSAHAPTPEDPVTAEIATQGSFLQGNTTLLPGLSMLDITIEPRVMQDNRWGRLFSLAHNFPEQVAFGLNENTAIEITSQGASALGDGPVFSLDLRQAQLDLGSNQAFVIANGIMDVFAPGDAIQPATADVENAPVRAATPVLASPTQTQEPAPTLTVEAVTPIPTSTIIPSPTARTPRPGQTRTPRPTAVPPVIPPPSDPNLMDAIILMGIFTVLIILIGVWINRKRLL